MTRRTCTNCLFNCKTNTACDQHVFTDAIRNRNTKGTAKRASNRKPCGILLLGGSAFIEQEYGQYAAIGTVGIGTRFDASELLARGATRNQ